MKEHVDEFGNFIEHGMINEAKHIEDDLEARPSLKKVCAGDNVTRGLYEKISEYEDEKLISMLSDEARDALMTGRRFMEEQRAQKEAKVLRKKKKKRRLSFSFAAVAVLVVVIGITSVGEPNRIVEIMKQAIGEREMTQVESDSQETKKSGESEEEIAYEKVEQDLKVSPVRIVGRPEGMKFLSVEIDTDLRVSYLRYENEGKSINYIISDLYLEDSLGYDVEDKVVKNTEFPLEKVNVKIKEFILPEESAKRYEANFKYNEIYYRIVGIMEKKELELILRNLHFF